jgi:Protein of unknown function (DUF3040)
MSPSAQEKPLSLHEQTILAALEEELRVEDPALAAALSQTPPSSPTTPQFRGPRPAGSAWSALPTGIQYGTALLAVVLFLVAQPLVPPSWRAVLGVALWLVVLPVGYLWFFGRTQRRDTAA